MYLCSAHDRRSCHESRRALRPRRTHLAQAATASHLRGASPSIRALELQRQLVVEVGRRDVLGVDGARVDVIPIGHRRRQALAVAAADFDLLQLVDDHLYVLAVTKLARHRDVGLANVPVASERRGQLAHVDDGPIDVLEEGHRVQRAHAVGLAAREALVGVLDQEPVDYSVQLRGGPLACDPLAVHRAALAVEDQLPQAVPVDARVVRLLVLHLGSHVPLRAADRLALLRLRVDALFLQWSI